MKLLVLLILQYQVSTTVIDLVVVFTLFVFMLALLCFCVATVFSLNTDLYLYLYIYVAKHVAFRASAPVALRHAGHADTADMRAAAQPGSWAGWVRRNCPLLLASPGVARCLRRRRRRRMYRNDICDCPPGGPLLAHTVEVPGKDGRVSTKVHFPLELRKFRHLCHGTSIATTRCRQRWTLGVINWTAVVGAKLTVHATVDS